VFRVTTKKLHLDGLRTVFVTVLRLVLV